MIQPEKIRQEINKIKLEVILEKILEEQGYMFDEEEFYNDWIKIKENLAYVDETSRIDVEILKKIKKERILKNII